MELREIEGDQPHLVEGLDALQPGLLDPLLIARHAGKLLR